MIKRLSMTLTEKLFLLRDTIEHSLFYLALAGIMLCAVLFLAIPSSIMAKDSSRKTEDLTITLAGAGTENADEEADIPSGSSYEFVSAQIIQGCSDELDNALQAAREGTEINAFSEAPVESAALIGYAAINTVEENRLMSYTDYSTLLQIVEAECTGGDELSKQYVACVVLNRTRDDHFPDTVYDVVWQRLYGHAQFSPTQDGRMGRQKITDTTVSAVNKAITGEDISDGALFFIARKHASKTNANWFDTELEYLFSHGGHEFFRFKDEQ